MPKTVTLPYSDQTVTLPDPRTPAAVRAVYKSSPAAIMARLDKLTGEYFYRQKEGVHPAHATQNQTMAEVKDEIIATARALVESLDAESEA